MSEVVADLNYHIKHTQHQAPTPSPHWEVGEKSSTEGQGLVRVFI
jgi:hypothetical protein